MSPIGNIASLLALGMTLGCQGGASSESKRAGADTSAATATEHENNTASENKKTPAGNDAASEDGGDDGTVDILVPMGLWDPNALADAVKSIPLTLSGTFELPPLGSDISSEPLVLALPTFETQGLTSFAATLQDVPATMTSFMRQLLSLLGQQLQTLVGEGGIYADQEITIKTRNGRGSVTLEVEAPNLPAARQPGYAIIAYDAAAPFPFALDVYEMTAEGSSTYRRMARWEFKEVPGGTLALRAQIAQPMDQTHTSHFILEHTQGEKHVRLSAGSSGLAVGADRIVIDYRFDDAWAMVQGAYGIAGAPAASLPGLPRYAKPKAGDAHLFRGLADLTAPQGEAVQELAFVAVEEAVAASYQFSSDRFAAAGYVEMGLESVAGLLQNPLLNPGCASSGPALRAKLTGDGYAVPPSLAAAPDSFCAADATITAGKVAEIVYDICWVTLPEGTAFTAPGASFVTIDLCESLTAVTLLSNPQRVYLDADGKRVVQTSSTRPSSLDAFLTRGPDGPAQQSLATQMAQTKFPDVSYLADDSWPAEITKTVSEFAGATVLRK